MTEPAEYEFTKLAKFIARRNNCEYCGGTGVSWEQVLFVDGGPSREIVKVSCAYCSDPLPTEEEVEKEAAIREVLTRAGVWEATEMKPEFLDKNDPEYKPGGVKDE